MNEEELLPLTEMDHLSDSETIPYYQFINKKLLEMTKSEIVLELIDIDVETKDNFNTYPNRKFNRKNSFATHLTNNIMTNSSALVRFCYKHLYCSMTSFTYYYVVLHMYISGK